MGTEGSITALNPLAPQLPNALVLRNAGITHDHLCRAFVDHVGLGTPFFTKGAESVANMATIDSIYQAAGLSVRGDGPVAR